MMSDRDDADVEREILELQKALTDARVKLVDSSLALQEKSRNVTEWRSWYREHPGYCLVGAFALGVFLGRR